MFSVTVDLTEFRRSVARTVQALEFGVRDAARNAAEDGAQEAKRQGRFQNRTGHLRESIVARFLDSTQRSAKWEILSGAFYSKYVEYGTRPHEIWPKAAHGSQGPLRNGQTRRASGKGPHEHIVGRGQFLRWVSGGQSVFARMVHHPGTQPDYFMAPAYFKAERVLIMNVELAVEKAAQYWR